MGDVVICGYATVDYVVHTATHFVGRGTVAMRTPPDGAWPRPGGAVLYAGRQLSAAGHCTRPLTWVGDDEDGNLYRRVALATGLEAGGIVTLPDSPTARCLMIYDPEGGHGCLLRAGDAILSDEQQALLNGADLLVITAGPADAARALLGGLPHAARLAWIVKPDPSCFPSDLARVLAGRADWIFCNRSERAWLEEHRETVCHRQVLFETQGGDGVVVVDGGHAIQLPVEPLVVTDPTGAGDSFAGATLAALLDGDAPEAAAVKGILAAAKLLQLRC